MLSIFRYRVLFWLVMANIASTILHYTDNVIHFAHYPEPDWLNAKVVDLFWFFMTPFAFAVLYFYKRHKYTQGYLCLIAYCAMSLLVLGHYNYAPFFDISFKIHLFIWLEAILAVILAIYGSFYYYFQPVKPLR